MSEPDMKFLRQWIGRQDSKNDVITPGLVERFRATLHDLVDCSGDSIPLALHWCLAPPAVPESETGQDGHPARGGFLPPVENARRMWGGGEIEFLAPFQIGDEVERISTIAEIDLKSGRSGKLVIVGVDHEFRTVRGLCIRERQNIVYRLPAGGEGEEKAEPNPARHEEAAPGEFVRECRASTLLMFRYSALTFNGHRIHYDRDYAMNEEGYPGLVFHGPLQATLLANLAQELGRETGRDRLLRSFAYKGVSPLFGGSSFTLNANHTDDGFSLWVVDESGAKTMTATAHIH